MKSYTKRMIAYFIFGGVAAFTIDADAFLVAPLLIFLDLTVDIVRSRYQDFKDEQQKIIDDLSK